MWFTETAWPPIVICLSGAAVLLALWYRTQRGKFLVGTAALLAVSGLLQIIEQRIVTPAEEVESAVTELADAVVADNISRTLEFFSNQAADERSLVAGALSQFRVTESTHIKDLEVRMEASNSLAIAHFRANGTVESRGGRQISRHVATRWEFRFRREAGEWKIISMTRLDPLSGREIALLNPSLN